MHTKVASTLLVLVALAAAVAAQSTKIFVTGLVKRPGSYLFVEGMTAAKAIDAAGGFLHEGPASQYLEVARLIDGNLTRIAIKPDDLLQANDVLEIGQRVGPRPKG